MKATETWNPDLYNDKHSFVYDYGNSLIELLEPKNGEHILDVGCGSGQLTSQIASFGSSTVGIDSSETMIMDARIRFPQLRFEVMDASDLKFQEKFDAVFSNAALHWVLDSRGAAVSMFNCLNPGGRLVLEMGGKGNVQAIIESLRKILAKYGYHKQAAHEQWFFPSIAVYAAILEDAGFRIKLAQHFDRPTLLAAEESGITDWLTMFADGFFVGVNAKDRIAIMNQVQDDLKERCLVEGKWYADYKRLRIVAERPIS
ncbi:class I SAM-dependent methyltransferase [Robertkochia solimangrovi]|uniref:class I SAM-dependent methyltransferase n=1 Tax=Robertkochia solimangrovi TaxID=2213046 RepID=UPI00117D2CAF|nr:methyltransferase domain-containing protein [Robertkochia solimangrovi]TRZ44295.1 SAM-dependent methyltransferase [Robertkochia solimangrovi]